MRNQASFQKIYPYVMVAMNNTLISFNNYNSVQKIPHAYRRQIDLDNSNRAIGFFDGASIGGKCGAGLFLKICRDLF